MGRLGINGVLATWLWCVGVQPKKGVYARAIATIVDLRRIPVGTVLAHHIERVKRRDQGLSVSISIRWRFEEQRNDATRVCCAVATSCEAAVAWGLSEGRPSRMLS